MKQNWLHQTLLYSRVPKFWTFCNGTGFTPLTRLNFTSYVKCKTSTDGKKLKAAARRKSSKVLKEIACVAVVFYEEVSARRRRRRATRFLLFLVHSPSLLQALGQCRRAKKKSERAKKWREEEREEPVSIPLNTSFRHYPAHFTKTHFSCQNVKFQNVKS